jgi:hypothetical protein
MPDGSYYMKTGKRLDVPEMTLYFFHTYITDYTWQR